MISTSNVGLSFGGRKLFEGVNIKFSNGNCYGLIGANGAGKSTFVKLLSGEIEPQTGSVDMPPNHRLSCLKQDHFAFDESPVLETVLMGNQTLYKILQEKNAIRIFSTPHGRICKLPWQWASCLTRKMLSPFTFLPRTTPLVSR